jgi:hypothetical protein
MILMKQLENKKRNDDRKKKNEELRVEKERERDKRIEMKKLEMEILNESRKPVEDMALHFDQTETALKVLPTFERIPNMCLSGEAFANCMMIYEFLNNFGETLGFGKFCGISFRMHFGPLQYNTVFMQWFYKYNAYMAIFLFI